MGKLTQVAIREAVHAVMLWELVRSVGSDAFVLKGGVNLRLFFGSVRYSEDMDLDGEPPAAVRLREAIRGFIESPNREVTSRLGGLGVRELDPGEGPNKDTDTTFRYSFRVAVGGESYPTKIEVSYRARHVGDITEQDRPISEIVSAYLPDEELRVQHYTRESAIRQKVAALAGRRRPQARDVFDLYVLGEDVRDRGSLKWLGSVLDPGLLERATEEAYRIDYDQFRGQVLEYLDDEDREVFASARKWDEVRLEVLELIEAIKRVRE